jgi:hypothetical protein
VHHAEVGEGFMQGMPLDCQKAAIHQYPLAPIPVYTHKVFGSQDKHLLTVT